MKKTDKNIEARQQKLEWKLINVVEFFIDWKKDYKGTKEGWDLAEEFINSWKKKSDTGGFANWFRIKKQDVIDFIEKKGEVNEENSK